MDTCTLSSTELPGGGSAWHVMSSCSNPVLQAQRERMAGPFGEVVTVTIEDLDKGEWGHREEVAEAFRRVAYIMRSEPTLLTHTYLVDPQVALYVSSRSTARDL